MDDERLKSLLTCTLERLILDQMNNNELAET